MKNKYAAVFFAVVGLSRAGLAAEQETSALPPPMDQAAPEAAAAASPAAQTPVGGTAPDAATNPAQPAPADQGQATASPAGDHAAVAATTANEGQPPSPASNAGEAQGVTAAIAELLQTLVQQGVLTQDKASDLLQKMQQKLQAQTDAKRPPPPADPNVVGVPYVPQFVKDEIAAQLRDQVRKDVMKDVEVRAKEERWNMPDVIPLWLRQSRWYGDIRVRAQGDMFANDNAQNFYVDFQKVNAAGGIGKTDNPFINTDVDRYRLRLRARFGMEAWVADNVSIALRLTTGNSTDPLSTNQTLTLGNTASRYQAVWDQAFLRYEGQSGFTKLTMYGGRMPDPWLHTDLVWAPELGFDGVAGTLNYNLLGIFRSTAAEAPERSVFLTAGAFPIQEIELSSRDKWLYGAQLGSNWETQGQSVFKMGLAYYNFTHITGERNALDSKLLDFTAPQSIIKGNTVYDIRNDTDPTTNLFALASDYHLVNLTAFMDFPLPLPIDLMITADYVKNIGFDEKKVQERTGVAVKARTEGYMLALAVGKKNVDIYGDWRVTAAYKYLQRDAVVDALTDPDFHLGGTDAQGWILQYDFGLTRQTWLTARWLTSDSIDGPPLGIDTFQLDINARF